MARQSNAALQATSPQIVHESETQRQHVRVKIPAVAKIGATNYRVVNLSTGGCAVRSNEKDSQPQGMQEIKILFPFKNFSFHLNLKAVFVYHDSQKNTVGFSFQEVDARQISLLNHIVKSCLNGMMVGEGDVIDVVSRNNFTAPRREKPSNDNFTKSFLFRILPFSAIVLAGMVGLLFLFGNIYENSAIIKSYMGVVEGNVFVVRAQRYGVYNSLLAEGDEAVTKGQPLAVLKSETDINPPDGGYPQKAVIESPCDCTIVAKRAQEGEFSVLGDPLFELLPKEGYTWVTASLRPEQIHRLKLLDEVRIKIAGEGTFIEGNVSEFLPPASEKDMARVKIRTKTPISPELVGRLAYVEFIVR